MHQLEYLLCLWNNIDVVFGEVSVMFSKQRMYAYRHKAHANTDNMAWSQVVATFFPNGIEVQTS